MAILGDNDFKSKSRNQSRWILPDSTLAIYDTDTWPPAPKTAINCIQSGRVVHLGIHSVSQNPTHANENNLAASLKHQKTEYKQRFALDFTYLAGIMRKSRIAICAWISIFIFRDCFVCYSWNRWMISLLCNFAAELMQLDCFCRRYWKTCQHSVGPAIAHQKAILFKRHFNITKLTQLIQLLNEIMWGPM